MFSQVCESVGSGEGEEGSPCDHYPLFIRPHCKWSPSQTLEIISPGPSPPPLTSIGHQWTPVQTCSLEETPLLPSVLTFGGYGTHGWQSERYAYYWNGF